MRTVKRNKKRLWMLSIAMFIICTMAFGYAIFSEGLQIAGTGTISANWDILFTSIEEKQVNGAVTNQKQIMDKLTAIFDVNLDFPGSYIEYHVTLKNNGNMDAVIESIEGIDEANNEEPTGIQFQIEDLASGDDLLAGSEKVLTVRAEIPEGETTLPTGSKTLELKVNVKQKDIQDGGDITLGEMEEPVLKEGMIPVTYDTNGNTVKADTDHKWYDYNGKKWANAVSVTTASRSGYQSATPGTVINEDDILAYFVWIPRYRYRLWNAEYGVSKEQEIRIMFERVDTSKSSGTKNGQWLTHPAFTFGGAELAGIWVGKFETTGTSEMPTIKPNHMSLTNQNNKKMFDTIRKFSTSGDYGLSSYDSHMIKNMEWGAVAYLTNSQYGRCTNGTCSEVWINNVNTGYGNDGVVTGKPQWGPSITGCSGTSVSVGVKSNMTVCEAGRDYKQAGVNASTTGNITGIYDMSGGTWERTMAVMRDEVGNILYSSSGFGASNMPDSKYYDLYETKTGDYDFTKGKLGDATREIIKKKNVASGGWYNDYSYIPDVSYPWFNRGGCANDGNGAGTFYFNRVGGRDNLDCGSRVVMVAT